MKVVHIFNEFKFSGAEKMYVEAAPIFQQNGCELTAIATGKNLGEFVPKFIQAGYEIFHFPMPDLRNEPIQFIKYFLKFYSFLKMQSADIIHIHKNGGYWWYALCAYIAGIKSIRTFHSIFINSKKIYWIKYWLERWSAKHFFGTIFQSVSYSVKLNENRYFNKTNLVYNWYGSNFYPAEVSEKRNIRMSLNIEPNYFVIISIGSCSKNKNHHEIIKSLPLLKDKEKYLYLHLGTGITEYEEKALAKELNLYDKIRFEGNKLNVRDYIISADVYIMTSTIEGFGLATIEAQACGIPVIVYNNPGVSDVVVNEFNGFVIKPDYHLVAEKINYLFHNNYKATEMGKNGIAYSKENFSLEKNVNKILELYLK